MKTMSVRCLSAVSLLSVVAAGTALVACGSKDKDDVQAAVEKATGEKISIAGKLQIADSTAAGLSLADAPALSSLLVSCVTFTKPPVAGEGKVGADGSFSIQLAAAKAAVGCFIVKESNGQQEVLATLVFQDTSKQDLSGNADTNSRLAFNNDTNLGAIKLDLAKGTAVADVKNFKDKIVENKLSAKEAFDFSGNWKLSAPKDFKLPEGYQSTCAPDPARENDCEGVPEGMIVHFRRYAGKRFEQDAACKAARDAANKSGAPLASCGGKTTEEPAYALSLWHNKKTYESCGSKLGVSDAELKAFGGLDLSAYKAEFGKFAFHPDFVDGWKHKDAVARHSQADCGNVRVNGKDLWRCKGNVITWNNGVETDTGLPGYSDGIDGGCKNVADGSEVRIKDWSKVQWSNDPNNNNREDLSTMGWPKGYYSHKSQASYEGMTLECRNIHGNFKADGSPLDMGHVRPVDLIQQGQRCDQIGVDSDAKALAQLRCYANTFYDRAHSDEYRDSCLPELRTNWEAKDARGFVERGGDRPNGNMMLQVLKYTDGDTATLVNQEDRSEWLQIGNNGVNCKIFSIENITIRKVTNTKVLFEMTETMRNVSLDKPACVAKFGGEPTSKRMFYGDKQP